MHNGNQNTIPDNLALISRDQIVLIVQSLAGHVDLRAAVDAISQELAKVIPHDHLDAALLIDDHADLLVYETGIQTSWGQKRRKVADSPIRDILLGKASDMITEDAMSDPRMTFKGSDTAPIREFGLRARIHTKIEIAGNIIGALSLSSRDFGIYHTQHIQAVQIVANVVGPYFYALRVSEIAQTKTLEHAQELNLRKGAEHVTEAQERERVRIGMDLHDQVLADLSRLVLRLDDNRMTDGQKLRETRGILSEAIQDVRNIVEDAKPMLLEMFGLGTAIEAFLVRAVEGSEIQGVMLSDPGDLDELFKEAPQRRLTLFRIAQEAINNAVRHSGAKSIHVDAEQTGFGLRLRVSDNGCGFEPTPIVLHGGLRNMKARATLISAAVHIGARSGSNGTCVLIELPKFEGTTWQPPTL